MKGIYNIYHSRLQEIPLQILKKIASKYDISKARVYAYADGVKVRVGLHGYWITIFIRKRRLFWNFKIYEFVYYVDGKIKRRKSFSIKYLEKAILEADIIDVNSTKTKG